MEGVDHPVPLHRIVLPEDADLASSFQAEMLDGVIIIHAQALMEDDADWGRTLYRWQSPRWLPVAITAIPYYAWDNRQPGEMRIWFRRKEG